MKLLHSIVIFIAFSVAIVLTVYGIETLANIPDAVHRIPVVAIVLTVYGIETHSFAEKYKLHIVAIVLTVYGIETSRPLRQQITFVPLQ